MIKNLLKLAFICLFAIVSPQALAQLPTAAFTANKTSGCSPVVVQFTNQSTGATSWLWDLGNGGSSTLQHPSATYFTPGKYRVVLTATNSNGSKRDTSYITVNTAPTVSFTTDTTSSCGSKTVTFNNTTVAGSTGAVTYLWDFGDGDSSSAVNPTHIYTYSGNFTVSLIATNSDGCTDILTKTSYIKVAAKPVADYVADKTSGCGTPLQVTFTDKSTDAVSRSWSFGDGGTATSASPSHTYNASGSYTVRLIVTAANGCKDTLNQSSLISIGQVVANFTTNTPLCAGKAVVFTNTTTPGTGAGRTWTFGTGASSTVVNPTYTYASAGTYTVTLIERYDNNCIDTVSKTITINSNPVAAFSTNDTVGCRVPFTANFTNQSTGATSYLWSSGIPGSSPISGTNPPITYQSNFGLFTVTLTATSAQGCQSVATKPSLILIRPPFAKMVVSDTGACVNGNIKFTGSLTQINGTYYWWDFGDGTKTGCDTCSVKNHSYANTGTYTVRLAVSSSAICSDTITQIIKIGTKPTAAFSGTPLSICPKNDVTFTNTSTGANAYTWSFGDGKNSTVANPVNKYDEHKLYTVMLIASNDGCKDTMTRKDYVTVLLPKARFRPTFQCSSRLKYTFVDSSDGANTYSWSFGDGNTSATKGSVTHTYNAPGTYTVILRVTNTANGCIDTIAHTINAKPIVLPTLTANDTTICRGNLFVLSRAGSSEYTYATYFGNILNASGSQNLGWYPSAPGVFDIKVVVTDSFGCKDSVVKKDYVKVGGMTVNYTASNLSPCKEIPIQFDDNTPTTIYPIVSRFWYFGDGQQDYSVNDTITHKYNNTGPYNVKLVVTDANGCKDSLVKNSFVYVYKPFANFFTNDTSICSGQQVNFTNNSGGADFTSKWEFGDGKTSTSTTPSNVYSVLGAYTVKLVLTDKVGCKDSLTKTNYIKVEKPTAAFTLSDTFGACPPLTIQANNTSAGSNTYAWAFGNNNQSSLSSPSITYTYPGTYAVKLVAINGAGCTDTATRIVKVNGPTGTYNYTPKSGCNPVAITLTASSNNTTSYIWDMNNGVTQSTSTPSYSYTYTQTGRYVPRLVLSDGASCLVPVQNNDTIVVDDLQADFSFTSAGNLCGRDTVYFNDTITTLSGVSTRSWLFGDGGASTAQDPKHFYAAPGSYQVRLIAGNANGCKDTVTRTVVVRGLPNVKIAAGSDSLCPGQAAGIQLTATGAVSYAWNAANGLSCSTCENPVVNPQANTKYIVTGTDVNGCSNKDSIVIGIRPKPVLTVNNDTAICQGASVALTVKGAANYAWSPSAELSCVNCTSPVAMPTNVGTYTYTVIGTSAGGCKDTANVTVTVQAKPNVTAGADVYVCTGDSIRLTATGATNYTWSPVGSLSCIGCSNPFAKPASTTTYTVIGAVANGCKDTATIKVSVNGQPIVSAGTDKEICIGDNITLQATGTASYTWSPATGLSCTTCANPVANPTATTTYTVIGANGNNCKDTATIKISVNALPVVSAGADKTSCAGAGVALQATGAVNYVWTPANDLSCANCANPTATPTITTSYIVTGTDAKGCKDTGAVKVNVKALPVVAAGTNKTICQKDSVQLNATGAATYTWTPATGLSCVGCANPKASPAATTVYTVTGMDAQGCKNTATVTVNVNALPAVNAGADQSICTGTSAQLQSTGGVSYTWTPATALSCNNCNNPAANPSATTMYTVTGTDANGCKNTDQVEVKVNTLPSISAGSNTSVCLRDSVQLQATGGATYTWTPATGLSCVSCANPKASPAVNTTYTVTGTDANGCKNTATVIVDVKAIPVVRAGNDVAICQGLNTNLQASGAASYTWTPATGLSCTGCANPTARPVVNTTYIVKGTSANGCSANDTVIVSVNTQPIVSAGTNAAICAGENTRLQASGAVSYTWATSSTLSCTSCADPLAKPATTTLYEVVGTDGNGCKDTAQVTVQVKTLPVISANAARNPICSGDTTQLMVSGATSYSWSPGVGLSCVTCSNPIATPQANTTYSVIGTANGCSDTATVTISTRSKPVVNAGRDTAFCASGALKLNGTGTAQDYVWSPATGLGCVTCTDPTATVTQTTRYTLTGTDANGCKSSDDILITINPLPNVNAGPDTGVCDGGRVQLQATGANSYVWSPANGLSCINCPNPFASTPGVMTYTVTGTDGNGCSNTDDITVSVIKKQPITYSKDDSICPGESVVISAKGGTDYEWFPLEGISAYREPEITASPLATTRYRVIVKQGMCFTDTGYVNVTVFRQPEIDAGADQDISGAEAHLEPRSSGVVKFIWSPAADLNCADCSNPVARPKITTTYTVKGISEYGCVAEDTVTIRVGCGPDKLFVANTFTPNSDGLNDVFFPQGKGITMVKRFSIYSRWGELLYDAHNIPLNDPAYGWNGTYKAEPMKPDVFVYTLQAQCEDGTPVQVKGDVSLVR